MFGYVEPCRLEAVQLKIEKRNTSFEEQLDNGRLYFYTKLTGTDPDAGTVTTDWIYMGYKFGANSYTENILIDMYGDGMGVGGTAGATDALYDYITVVPEPTTVCLLGLGGLALMRRRERA
jgi:hypothetical protein